jgi:hypothetical protein
MELLHHVSIFYKQIYSEINAIQENKQNLIYSSISLLIIKIVYFIYSFPFLFIKLQIPQPNDKLQICARKIKYNV